MLSLTRKTDYALVALSFLGQQRAQGAQGEQAISARRIADQFGLPLPLLMNLLKELAHAGVVASVRGSQGGYVLAMDPQELTLMRIISATEGPARLVQCCVENLPAKEPDCRIRDACPIRQPIQHLHRRINEFLERVTLADLIESKVDVPVESVGA